MGENHPAMKRERTYWICQLVGWTGLMGLALVSQLLLFGFSWKIGVALICTAALGIFLSHIYRHLIHRWGWLKLPLKPLVPRIIAASFVVALLLTALGLGVGKALGEAEGMIDYKMGSFGIFTQFLNWAFIFLAWSSVYFGIHSLEDLQRTRVEKWQLEAAVKEAELKALRSQLNPHFLFNSLNNLRALIVEDPDRAQQAVTQLAGLLRYALQASKATTVPLQEELRIVRYYLDLEAIRLEERLRVEMDIDEGVLRAPVPPLLLQSLVENSIKHGIADLPEGGHLSIAASRNGSHFRLQVCNTGQIGPDNGQGGVGLENARARLALIFGDSAWLEIRNLPERQVEVQVAIPWPKGLES